MRGSGNFVTECGGIAEQTQIDDPDPVHAGVIRAVPHAEHVPEPADGGACEVPAILIEKSRLDRAELLFDPGQESARGLPRGDAVHEGGAVRRGLVFLCEGNCI